MKYWLIQKTVTRPLPANAKVETRGSRQVAICSSRDGKKKIYPVFEKDGMLRIRTKSEIYYARHRDEGGILQDVNTRQRDKSKAKTFAHNYFQRLERISLGIGTEEEFESRDKLSTPITELVKQYLASSEGKGNSVRYTEDQLRLLECLFTETDMKILMDIDANRIVEWMNKASKKNLTAKTVNSYLKQAKQFTKFCLKSGYLTRDPLQYLEYRKSPNDQQEKRRAFTNAEFQKLIDITSRRPIAEHGRETLSKCVETKSRRRNTWTKAPLTQQNFEECFERGKQRLASNPKLLSELQREGLERKLSYTIFTYTGMRLNELRSIRLSDIVEKGQQLLIVLRSQNAKNRKPFTFTLPSFICDEIREWIENRRLETTPSNGKTQESDLLTVPKQLVRILDRDLIAAGIAKKDERGRSVNVHAFRHTYCTWLQATGISQRIVQELMRHSSPELTANTYTHSDQLDLGGSVEKLPNPGEPNRNESSDPNLGEPE